MEDTNQRTGEISNKWRRRRSMEIRGNAGNGNG